jgi:hypothetical protein
MDAHLWKEGEPLGPIGTQMLFENEHVRVWMVDLPPKGRQPWHKHHLPYVVVPLTTATNAMRFEDGSTRRFTDIPGDVKWRDDLRLVHELYNLDENGPSRTVLVEIKGAKPA